MLNLSGVLPSPRDERDYPVSVIAPAITLPRSIRLDSRILSVRDQGFFPTCVGKSGASIMSAGFRGELATIPIYKMCKQLDGIPDAPGTYPRTAMKVMQKFGTCREWLLPYELMNFPMPSISPAAQMESEKYRIKSYARAWGLTDIKQALAGGHLLMGCMLVAENFMFYRGDSIIGPPVGEIYGYHAVTVCGAEDDLRALRIVNSYSKKWGNEGFGWVSYDYLMNFRWWPETWAVVIEVKRTAEEIYPDRIFRELRRYLKKN